MHMNASPLSPGARRHPIVRLLGSVKFGIAILTLVLVYASIGSGLAPIRGVLELTEMQVFRHWVFLLLLAIFCLSLITATVTRIRWNWANAGVLAVHTGLLVLIGGAAWYFGTKVEGDVLLITPRIELLSATPGRGPLVELAASPGEHWEQFMPAFGGPVRLEVSNVQGTGPAAAAAVKMIIGAREQSFTLRPDAPPVPLGNNLALRWRTFPAQTKFYDQERPALYYGVRGEHTPRFVEMRGLPLHRERYLPDQGPLMDASGRPAPSKRTRPALALGSLELPTSWFESWRMPIDLRTPELPFDVRVTGYLPYVAGTRTTVAGDGPAVNPLVEFRLRSGQQTATHVLAALDPRRRMLELAVPFEVLWCETAEERAAAHRPLVGQDELTIEVREPPARLVVPVVAGQSIEVPGTDYRLTVASLVPSWPLASPGFEGLRSPVAMVNVQHGDTAYQRTVIERFPQFSQDIDAQGQRHSAGPYDPNLTLRYRSAGSGKVYVLTGPGSPPSLAVVAPDGDVRARELERGRPTDLGLPGFEVDFTLLNYHERGRSMETPTVQPLELRRPNMGRGPSAVRLELTGRGAQSDWRETHWCFFSDYPHLEAGTGPAGLTTMPLVVRGPDGVEYELVYSRAERDLGTTLVPGRLKTEFFPGRRGARTWQSDFFVQAGDTLRPAMVRTNQTFAVNNWTLFQSGAARDHWGWTILGVGNRRGIWPMMLGCVLITVGCWYAFYIKPILKRRAAAAAAASTAARGAGRPALAAQPAVAEMER